MEKGALHLDEISRLKKIEGQVRGIQKMLEERRYCVDILLQLSAAGAAIKKVENSILKRHLETCFSNAFISGTEKEKHDKIKEVIDVLEKFNK
ncbi:MAG: metal-sensitive transcriptional regulator [bacterium]|nr:metal-sensitive transcriptional regulator [bacterium]